MTTKIITLFGGFALLILGSLTPNERFVEAKPPVKAQTIVNNAIERKAQMLVVLENEEACLNYEIAVTALKMTQKVDSLQKVGALVAEK